MYRIKQLSRLTGLSTETIRYYERIGVLEKPVRSDNGYRAYSDADVERLQFVRRARQLDFTLGNITEILAFRDQGKLPCDYVQQLLKNKIREVQDRLRDLQQLHDELTVLDRMSQEVASNEPLSRCVCQILEADIL